MLKPKLTNLIIATIIGLPLASTAHAGPDVTSQTTPIKPAEVMGDKNRSGPDGWVQAPVTRDEAPAQGVKSAGEQPKPTATTAPASAKTLSPGDDPGTPVLNPSNGPGRQTAAPK